MANEPERIWIDDERPIGGEVHMFTDPPAKGTEAFVVGYVRADVAEAMARAAVEAALREAAKEVEVHDAKWMRAKYEISYHKKRYDVLGVQRCENKFANILSEDIETAILALIPTGPSALDRVKAEAEARGVERAVKVAKAQHGDPENENGIELCVEAILAEAAAIRAQGDVS
jgi:hypothetical protein